MHARAEPRLGIDVPNHKLGTLAAYWGVPQVRAHDADDDVLVLSRVAVTGETAEPRVRLVERLTTAGLAVQNSVSRLTSALVCNTSDLHTRKAVRARAEGIAVLDETTLARLLDDVRPGEPVLTTAPVRRPRRTEPVVRGPCTGGGCSSSAGPTPRRRRCAPR